MTLSIVDPSAVAIPVYPVDATTWPKVRPRLSPRASEFAHANDFTPAAGRCLLLPGPDGKIEAVVFGLGQSPDPFLAGKLATALPPGVYSFEKGFADEQLAALAFLLGSYRFTQYREGPASVPQLSFDRGIDKSRLERVVSAVSFGRNLVNTPANDLGPVALAKAMVDLATVHKASVETIVGDDLLARNFPLIHAVGRAGHEAPRLVDLRWTGDPQGPAITLVGKGVTFDSGGLDIKPPAGMLLMKKDMGGAATALALAAMIMDEGLPVRLRVLVPIVENAIAGTAFRPGDVIRSRKGLSVEIGNTDAEGRLILADALAYADEEETDLLIDFATLTGAARVALGPDIAAFFTTDDELAQDIATQSVASHDPAWRLPLWAPYDQMLDSRIADLNNVAASPFAGSIVAALFLQRFVTRAKSWTHFDLFSWTPSAKPGRPEGGDVHAARMLYDLLRGRWSLRRPAAKHGRKTAKSAKPAARAKSATRTKAKR